MWMRNGGVGMRSDSDDELRACGEAAAINRIVDPATSKDKVTCGRAI
jgi:hypothetical protein